MARQTTLRHSDERLRRNSDEETRTTLRRKSIPTPSPSIPCTHASFCTAMPVRAVHYTYHTRSIFRLKLVFKQHWLRHCAFLFALSVRKPGRSLALPLWRLAGRSLLHPTSNF